MADLCLSQRSLDIRLLYLGAVGAGCSANMTQLAQGMGDGRPPELSCDGGTRSVALIPMALAAGELSLKVEVFVPSRQNECGLDSLLAEVDGVVFVADAGRDRLRDNLLAWADLLEGLRRIQRSLDSLSVVFQINKVDDEHSMVVVDLDAALNSEGFPSFPANTETGLGVGKCFSEVVRRAVARAACQMRLDMLGITRGALCGALDAVLVEVGGRAARRLREAVSVGSNVVEPMSESDVDSAPVSPRPVSCDESLDGDAEAVPSDLPVLLAERLGQFEQGMDRSVAYLRRVFECIAERSTDSEVEQMLRDTRGVLDYLERTGNQLGSWSRGTAPLDLVQE